MNHEPCICPPPFSPNGLFTNHHFARTVALALASNQSFTQRAHRGQLVSRKLPSQGETLRQGWNDRSMACRPVAVLLVGLLMRSTTRSSVQNVSSAAEARRIRAEERQNEYLNINLHL